MAEYSIITAEDTNDVSLWLEEYNSNFEGGYWDYNERIQSFCSYAYLRDAIFSMKLWGVMEKEDDEITGVFLIGINQSADECLSVIAKVYLSTGIQLLKFGVDKMKDIFEDDYSKIKFNFLHNENETCCSKIFDMQSLEKEASISLGRKRKDIYSIFLV